MTRILMNLLAGSLLVAGCSKSPQEGAPAAGTSRPPDTASVPAPEGDLGERAKAEALKEFSSIWTNSGAVWTSYVPQKKALIQLTNMSVRVEAVELTEKQRQKGITWGADVFFAAQSGRNQPPKGKWSEWRPTTPLRYPVILSNGVWYVENNFRKSNVLPPVSE